METLRGAHTLFTNHIIILCTVQDVFLRHIELLKEVLKKSGPMYMYKCMYM